MRIPRTVLLPLLLLLVVNTGSQPRPIPPAYPWHFVDIWWTSPSPTERFNEISIDFRIVGNVPDAVDLYVAPLGLATIGKTPLYGGVQTSTGGWPSKSDHNIVKIGRGGIFSRWSAENEKIPVEFAEGPSGTHYESADYENNFISVRRRAEWSSGSYTYVVRRQRTLPTDQSFVWFTAYLRNNSDGGETEIGSLRFDGPDYSLGPQIAAFVEVYGSASTIPQVTVVFSEPRVNGVHRPATAVTAIYPSNGTTGQPRFATSRKKQRQIWVTLRPWGIKDGVTEEKF